MAARGAAWVAASDHQAAPWIDASSADSVDDGCVVSAPNQTRRENLHRLLESIGSLADFLSSRAGHSLGRAVCLQAGASKRPYPWSHIAPSSPSLFVCASSYCTAAAEFLWSLESGVWSLESGTRETLERFSLHFQICASCVGKWAALAKTSK
ncbi:hypothetical protein UVI_02014230 [Ustilaginoidea virens]|uniref:Uncharacterized protein n=1 Tax=Ustilaginoidea virens TaxID=1159556 RepID=A0A1B5KRL6_USTVR|nr:hypothetical protein UVI_02014230 [Ustilaginoidea virens]